MNKVSSIFTSSQIAIYALFHFQGVQNLSSGQVSEYELSHTLELSRAKWQKFHCSFRRILLWKKKCSLAELMNSDFVKWQGLYNVWNCQEDASILIVVGKGSTNGWRKVSIHVSLPELGRLAWTDSFGKGIKSSFHRARVIYFNVWSQNTQMQPKVSLKPFPNKPWFLLVYNTSLLKTLWKKEKLLLFPQCFQQTWTADKNQG